ncbi:ribosome biogenesis protein Nop53/GLTSCR2 [Chytriomyces sp. MP71]|nr:ribosome biogenesis protein Nop53/GLTSCR2 [Chytriomyces sp. MP71]
MSTTKPRAASRKGKKAWKRNIDVTDIEDAINRISSEKRLTGSAIIDKTNASLFTIDKKGNEQAKLSLKHRKLKIEEILENSSGTKGPPPIGRKKTTVALEDHTDVKSGKKVKVASKVVVGKIEKIAKRLMQEKATGKGTHTTTAKKRSASEIAPKDVWGSNVEESFPDEANDFLAHVRPKKVKKPSLPEEKTNVPNVKVSHSGASYNPTFADHQGLLQAALDVELEKERANEVIKQKLSYPPELDNIDDENFFESEDEEDDDEDEGEQKETFLKPANKNVRKTRTQRNKEASKAVNAKKQTELLEQIKLKKQLNQLDEIKKAVEAKPSAPKPKKDKVKKTGPVPLKKQLLEIKLTDELPESLLKLKPEGNLFTDRFQSLQDRSLIEPRVPVGKRHRYKKKETERHDYKRFDHETFANL